jgi:hypothetical protein
MRRPIAHDSGIYRIHKRSQQHRWRTEISATNQARRARRDARKKGPPYCIGEAKLKRMIEHVEQGNYLNKYHGVELME